MVAAEDSALEELFAEAPATQVADTGKQWKIETITIRVEAIASRLEAIAGLLKKCYRKIETIASRLEAIAIRLEAKPFQPEEKGGKMEGLKTNALQHILGTILASFCFCLCSFLATYVPG